MRQLETKTRQAIVAWIRTTLEERGWSAEA